MQLLIIFLIGSIEYFLYASWKKIVLDIFTIVLISIPPFYIASLYIDLFSLKLNWINVINSSGFMKYFSPALCIAIPSSIFHGRLLGSIYTKIRKQNFIYNLQSRGISEVKIYFTHILPHGLILLVPLFMQILE